jgi:DNA-binding LacI/PurR family transcriptional regulator
MREIAHEAGVAVSTVSKALRDDPSIPKQRCREIRRLANQMGYRPNPLVATLMAQLHHHRRRDDPHTIAWMDFWANEPVGFLSFNLGPCLEGAKKRAAALGYGIEVYRPAAEGLSLDRLRRILKARGIWGIIVPPVPDRFRSLALDMRGLAAVTIGTSLQTPKMHRVSPNHFQAAALAFQKMRDKSFSRVGMILDNAMNERVTGKWLGAFLAESMLLPARDRVSPLIIRGHRESETAIWLKRQRPDAVLLAEAAHAQMWLDRGPGGRKSIAWLMQAEAKSGSSGLDYHPGRLGRLAVDMVVGQIHRNERGTPSLVHTTLVDAAWKEF